jgi:beta-lactamase class A
MMHIRRITFQDFTSLFKHRFAIGIVPVITLLIGLISGYLLNIEHTTKTATRFGRTLKEVREEGYKFTNPLLECDLSEEVGFEYYKASFDNASKIIEKYKSEGRISEAAVYFRDMNNGPWYSINEELLFQPASLFKLPILVAYYKEAESIGKENLFGKKITIEVDDTSRQTTKPEKFAEKGKTYAVQELIDLMIVYSDNNATVALFQNIDQDRLKTTYNELGLIANKSEADVSVFQISVKNYSSIFRLLYNGSYLSKNSSEEVLNLLSTSTYKGGLRKAIPQEIPVSHKFGERGSKENGEVLYQLHDCGIVYYPKRPFLLCLMTKGKSMEELPRIIDDLASDIYGEFDQKIKETTTK